MSVPPSSHRAWTDIVTGKVKYDFEFLAAKMVTGRLQNLVLANPSVEIVEQSVKELREVFAKNENLTKVQKDLAKIFGKGALR
jgi:hypothetical protein